MTQQIFSCKMSEKRFTQIYTALYGDAMLMPMQMGTSMAAKNQQKHPSIGFAAKPWNLSLEKLKNIKIILF